MKNKAVYIIASTFIVMSSSALAADKVDVDFYGKIHVSTDYLYDGHDGGFNVSSNSSRIGVKASHVISPELELIGQIERGVDVSEGSSTMKARSTYVGLRGDWGTVRVGYYSSPTMSMMSAIDEFRDRIGEGRNIVRQDAANMDRRLKSGVHYQSPAWQGFTLAVHYGTTETEGTTVDNKNDVFNTSLTYNTGSWTFIGGYQNDNKNPQQTVEGSRFAVIKAGDGWRIAAVAQHVSGLTDAVAATPTSMNAWGVTGRYQLSDKYWLRGQVFGRSYKNSADDSLLATVGVDRVITPRLTWYLLGSSTQNSGNAIANVTGGGYGDSMVVLAGDDPIAISTGVVFSF
ncbi:porin [Aliidiomarina quisquiliarum]|uniref:porin n=1 Tax=Aliidiomarina quisquiliarum TaxID=2938947 RepID=UPI00208FAF4E|nr:porin [Aliidiomarina quisquiliarum]MCO4322701.1 porin [Aliidiomarina quisquiliarum]